MFGASLIVTPSNLGKQLKISQGGIVYLSSFFLLTSVGIFTVFTCNMAKRGRDDMWLALGMAALRVADISG
jgi:hypothetical protein